jgi:hypothetical protein
MGTSCVDHEGVLDKPESSTLGRSLQIQLAGQLQCMHHHWYRTAAQSQRSFPSKIDVIFIINQFNLSVNELVVTLS